MSRLIRLVPGQVLSYDRCHKTRPDPSALRPNLTLAGGRRNPDNHGHYAADRPEVSVQHGIQLGGIDYVILVVYFLFVLGIGWALKRYTKTSEDFFLSGRA